MFHQLLEVVLMIKRENGANEAMGWQEAPGEDKCVIVQTPVSALGRLIRIATASRRSFLLAVAWSRKALNFVCYEL